MTTSLPQVGLVRGHVVGNHGASGQRYNVTGSLREVSHGVEILHPD
jgi:hypothetical protein